MAYQPWAERVKEILDLNAKDQKPENLQVDQDLEKIEQVQQLRDDAMTAHDNGDHAKSEELFTQAMKLFNS